MARVPVFRISFTNSTMLSAMYLAIGAAIEGVRRIFGFVWAERAALSLESFPARMLDFLGLYEPLKRAWMESHVTDTEVRLIYGFTVVALIYAMGLLVGTMMWVLQRRGSSTEPPIER